MMNAQNRMISSYPGLLALAVDGFEPDPKVIADTLVNQQPSDTDGIDLHTAVSSDCGSVIQDFLDRRAGGHAVLSRITADVAPLRRIAMNGFPVSGEVDRLLDSPEAGTPVRTDADPVAGTLSAFIDFAAGLGIEWSPDALDQFVDDIAVSCIRLDRPFKSAAVSDQFLWTQGGLGFVGSIYAYAMISFDLLDEKSQMDLSSHLGFSLRPYAAALSSAIHAHLVHTRSSMDALARVVSQFTGTQYAGGSAPITDDDVRAKLRWFRRGLWMVMNPLSLKTFTLPTYFDPDFFTDMAHFAAKGGNALTIVSKILDEAGLTLFASMVALMVLKPHLFSFDSHEFQNLAFLLEDVRQYATTSGTVSQRLQRVFAEYDQEKTRTETAAGRTLPMEAKKPANPVRDVLEARNIILEVACGMHSLVALSDRMGFGTSPQEGNSANKIFLAALADKVSSGATMVSALLEIMNQLKPVIHFDRNPDLQRLYEQLSTMQGRSEDIPLVELAGRYDVEKLRNFVQRFPPHTMFGQLRILHAIYADPASPLPPCITSWPTMDKSDDLADDKKQKFWNDYFDFYSRQPGINGVLQYLWEILAREYPKNPCFLG